MQFKAICLLLISLIAAQGRSENWPQFRGRTGQGISAEKNLPIHWSSTENIAWKTAIPGDGWSSPIVWGDRIFLSEAEESGSSCHVLCVGLEDGKILWNVAVFKQVPARKETKNSYATPTPVTDGEHVFVFFGGGGAVALDFAGQVTWKNSDNNFYSQHGLGSSPILYQDLLLMPWDQSIKEGPEKRIGWQIPWDKSYVWALDQRTGKERYKAMRGMSRIAHMTPQVVEVDGKPQLVSAAGDVIEGFDPDTGERLWWVTSGGEGVVPSPVIGDGKVISSSGFPTPVNNQPIHAAIRAFKLGGHGDVTQSNLLWEQKKNPPMIPSLLLKDGLVYSVKEDGRAQCLDATDGKIIWEKRLPGTYSASPVWVDGKVYFLNDNADTTVIEAGRVFKQIAFNEIGEPCQASMAVSGGRLIIRTGHTLFAVHSTPVP